MYGFSFSLSSNLNFNYSAFCIHMFHMVFLPWKQPNYMYPSSVLKTQRVNALSTNPHDVSSSHRIAQ